MYRFAIYGKGGIGKSTVTTALSCAFAEMGLRVLQVGCDPKADSTLYLHGGQRIDTMLDVLRQKRDSAELADLVHVGYKDIVCAEAGGPTPGLGCAGRGIAAAFEALEARDAFDIIQPDVVLYDVLGDVVCGGFAVPIREGYAEDILIVTSGEKMALYAANNIRTAVDNFADRGYASVKGIVFNHRNVPREEEKVGEFARNAGIPIVGDIPRSDEIIECEEEGMTVVQGLPDSEISGKFFELADFLLKEHEKERKGQQVQ